MPLCEIVRVGGLLSLPVPIRRLLSFQRIYLRPQILHDFLAVSAAHDLQREFPFPLLIETNGTREFAEFVGDQGSNPRDLWTRLQVDF